MTGWRTLSAITAVLVLLGVGFSLGFAAGDESTPDDALTISRDDFVDIVQICFALDSGLTPFAPETPIATPPQADQGTLDAMLADCGRR